MNTILHLYGPQMTSNSQSMLEEYQAWVITLPEFKLSHKVIIIKTVWHWHKNRHIYQWNKIKSAETNSHIYSKPTFYKGAKNNQCRNNNPFDKWCWGKHMVMKKNETEALLYTTCKINSKWIRDLFISKMLNHKTLRKNHR